MFLMNGNKPVLEFSLEDMYINVLDNNFLPYELKDFIKTSNPFDFKKTVKDLETFKDFLSSRVLLLSRENAKVILNVASLPQSLKTEDRIKIVLACKGLSMTDNFWIKEDGECKSFADVNLRNNKLSDASYEIAILGKHISATSEELRPDLYTIGMFPKYWKTGTKRAIKRPMILKREKAVPKKRRALPLMIWNCLKKCLTAMTEGDKQ